jgi:hypothetical protein
MSDSVINVHSHPILPAYGGVLRKTSDKPPEKATVSGDPARSWNVVPVLVDYLDLLRLVTIGVS